MYIRLRPYKSSDAPFLISWVKDEKSAALWSAGAFSFPLTKVQLERYQAQYEQDKEGFLMTAVDKKGIPVGHIRMEKLDYEENSLWFGNIIVDDTRRGVGLGSHMLNCAFVYAFEVLKMDKITLGVFEENEAARKCYERLGFTENGVSSEYRIYQEEVWKRYDMELHKR